jgi:osmotically-inducible protein OsmY
MKDSKSFGTEEYEKIDRDLEGTEELALLKNNLRLNTTGLDDDLAIDIQDAIGREMSLSLVSNNILVTVEGEIVTLIGEVHREQEKMTAGDIAATLAGDDNVINYLRIANN